MSFFFLFNGGGAEPGEPIIVTAVGTAAGTATVIGRPIGSGETTNKWRLRVDGDAATAQPINRIRTY